MATQLNIVLGMSIISVLLTLEVEAQASTFNVVGKFGAKADGKTDMSKTLLDVFKVACASKSAAKVLIPEGSFLLSGAKLQGPCKGPIEIVVEGTVNAPPDVKAFKEPVWISFNKIQNFKLSSGVFDGKGAQAYKRESCVKNDYCKHLPISLRFDSFTNAMVQGVTSKDPKQFHVNVLGCKNITFDKFIVSAPKESPNTDGIHIGRSDGVKVLNTKIQTDDDCVSFGDGSENVLIKGVTCGPGHRISIGSIGLYQMEQPVKGITISQCTLTNTKNGVRIKTWPNSYPVVASDMYFEDITIKNVDFPIIVRPKILPVE